MGLRDPIREPPECCLQHVTWLRQLWLPFSTGPIGANALSFYSFRHCPPHQPDLKTNAEFIHVLPFAPEPIHQHQPVHSLAAQMLAQDLDRVLAASK